ncbi:hypothetical protein [Micromonospora sp. WMMD736]|uniref:hypothetical protein n=1 Tax=Micromonospora sp. WMMD736 TaxID=3404112 RepID=UPI003B95938E
MTHAHLWISVDRGSGKVPSRSARQDSDRTVTDVFLFPLQRHGDHHANPLRRYRTLRSFDSSPLRRRVMDHRLLAHYGGGRTLADTRPRR